MARQTFEEAGEELDRSLRALGSVLVDLAVEHPVRCFMLVMAVEVAVVVVSVFV